MKNQVVNFICTSVGGNQLKATGYENEDTKPFNNPKPYIVT